MGSRCLACPQRTCMWSMALKHLSRSYLGMLGKDALTSPKVFSWQKLRIGIQEVRKLESKMQAAIPLMPGTPTESWSAPYAEVFSIVSDQVVLRLTKPSDQCLQNSPYRKFKKALTGHSQHLRVRLASGSCNDDEQRTMRLAQRCTQESRHSWNWR